MSPSHSPTGPTYTQLSGGSRRGPGPPPALPLHHHAAPPPAPPTNAGTVSYNLCVEVYISYDVVYTFGIYLFFSVESLIQPLANLIFTL